MPTFLVPATQKVYNDIQTLKVNRVLGLFFVIFISFLCPAVPKCWFVCFFCLELQTTTPHFVPRSVFVSTRKAICKALIKHQRARLNIVPFLGAIQRGFTTGSLPPLPLSPSFSASFPLPPSSCPSPAAQHTRPQVRYVVHSPSNTLSIVNQMRKAGFLFQQMRVQLHGKTKLETFLLGYPIRCSVFSNYKYRLEFES